uniref:HDC17589 n=1 Tax=Drosophila melanogaster TaxID=7227 RepID=Q6IIM7_DROME|nr:TPA_inf: HDC17589 [Drosophila melanogaster]
MARRSWRKSSSSSCLSFAATSVPVGYLGEGNGNRMRNQFNDAISASARQLQNLCGDHWHHGCGMTLPTSFLFLSATKIPLTIAEFVMLLCLPPLPTPPSPHPFYMLLLFLVAIIDFPNKFRARRRSFNSTNGSLKI